MKNPRTKLAFFLLAIAAAVFWFFLQKTDLSQELERKPQKQQPQTVRNESESARQKEKQQQEKQQKETSPTKTLREQARDLEIALTPEGEIDTSNWQTYRNRSCGLEVKLPKSWKLHQDLDCKKHPNKVPEADDNGYLAISFQDTNLERIQRQNLQAQEMVLAEVAYFYPFDDTLEVVEKNNFLTKYPKRKVVDNDNGIIVEQYLDKSRGVELSRKYLIRKEGSERIFLLDMIVWDSFDDLKNPTYQLYKKIFTQIIKSIKILD